MLNKISKFVLALVLFVPLTMLSGCSSAPDGVELMQEVNKVMKKVDSMSMEMNYIMDVKIEAGGSSLGVNMEMNMDAEFINDPMKAHATTKVKASFMGSENESESEMYMLEEDGYVSTVSDEGYGYAYSSSSIPMNSTVSLYSLSKKELEKMDVKVSNGEKVDGKDTYQVNLTIGADKLSEILSEAVDSSPLGDVDMDDMKFTYSLFVDKDSKEVLKVSIDLKDEFQKLMEEQMQTEDDEALLEGMSVTIDAFSIEMLMSDFNEIDDIEIPEEALAAMGTNGSAESDYQTTEGDISTQTHAWETMKVNVDGNEVVVGETKFQALLDAGFEINDSELNSSAKVEGEDSEYVSLSKGDYIYSVSVENRGDSSINLSECVITSFTFSSDAIALANDIKIGSSKEEVLAAYGEANTITNYGSEESWNYEMSGDDFYNSLSIDFEDGVVSYVYIDTYQY